MVQQVVLVLQRDERRLQRPQHHDRAAEDQRRPQHEMEPDRRREFDLDDGGEPDNDQPEKEDDENRRAVAGVLRRQIGRASCRERV